MLKLAIAIILLACTDSDARPVVQRSGAGSIRLERVGDFRSPVYLTAPAGDPRLFIVEQAGRIQVVKSGSMLSRPSLHISRRVRSGGEQGLLSMAFHPDYRNNGE